MDSWGKKKIRVIDGQAIEPVVGQPRHPRKRARERIFDEPVHRALKELWKLLDYQYGKRLVVLTRANGEVLKAQSELDIEDSVATALCRISAATVHRLLKAERVKLQIKGNSCSVKNNV